MIQKKQEENNNIIIDWMHDTACCLGYPSDSTRAARERAPGDNQREPPGSGRPGGGGLDATFSVLCGTSTRTGGSPLAPVAQLSPRRLNSRPRGSTPPLLAPVAQLSAPVAQLSHTWPASADSHQPLALGVQSGVARGRVRSNQATASLPSSSARSGGRA